MTQPKLPANWSRTAQTVQYEGTDLERDRADAIQGFAALQDVVAIGREILIHVAVDSEYVKASGATFREIRVEFWADNALMKAMRCDQLRKAIKVARFYASVLPNAFLVHRLDETVPRVLATTNARDLLFNVVPALSWHVEGLMPAGQVTLLSRDGGTGKSLIALQLAAATTAGRPWLGLEPTTGAAMVVSAEDDEDELHRRFVGICNEVGIGATELEGLHLRSLVGQDPLLGVLDPETRKIEPMQLFLELQRSVRETRPVLLVPDTLADCFGGDENVRGQARQFVGLLRNLTLAGETSVLCLAHPSLAGISTGTGASGSTGWNNSVRSRLYLERVMEWRGKGDNRRFVEPNPNARLLTIKKANYGLSGGTIPLLWHNGILERHETPAANDASLLAMQESAEEASARVDDKFLELLTAFTAEGRNVSPSPPAAYGPTLFAKHPRAEGIAKPAFAAALRRLLDDGQITIVPYGPPSKGTKRRTICADAGVQTSADPPANLPADCTDPPADTPVYTSPYPLCACAAPSEGAAAQGTWAGQGCDGAETRTSTVPGGRRWGVWRSDRGRPQPRQTPDFRPTLPIGGCRRHAPGEAVDACGQVGRCRRASTSARERRGFLVADKAMASPVLMRGPGIVAMKEATIRSGLSTKTLTRWCLSDGIGRRSSKAASWEISVLALEAKRYGDQVALEALRRGDFGSPSVRRYVEHLGLDL